MTTFNERERAFENMFVKSSELQFKAQARRDKMLGVWAAELLGKHDIDALRYVQELVAMNAATATEQVVFDRLKADFAAAGVEIPDDDLRRRMAALLTEAKAQLMTEEHF